MKLLLTKIAVFILIIVVLQLTTGRHIFNFIEYDNVTANFIKYKIKNEDLLYFGDSVLNAVDKNDVNKKSIPVILSERIDRNIYANSHGGYHVGIYLRYIEYLVKNKLQPSLIIIPINMRSFSQEWDPYPSYQFEKHSFILKYGEFGLSLLKPMSILTGQFKNTTQEQWQDLPVYDFGKLSGKVRDYQGYRYNIVDNSRLKNKILFHYRYKLKEDHRKLTDITKIIEICNSNKIKCLFYITPVDVNFCQSVYPGTKEIIEYNVNTILKLFKNKNAEVLDLSETLPSDNFSWKVDKYPNEHLNEKGRRYVAERLALTILSTVTKQ